MTFTCGRCNTSLEAPTYQNRGSNTLQVVVPTHLDGEGDECPVGGCELGIGWKNRT